ncbi:MULTISPECIES: AraC family transcriptional regulator [unclassified Modicisalibacter]|uniref:AraC family transcriptional regulator n=1 Tax=unclassified Modicisalibacter TaxID=2679913 RepID=UPI001CC942DA|nr:MULTISPECIES: AraC family transcriptional regulator [unclassified Modicisalibacter]MBZ9557855.1 AraC family transcriptional regulator [Modicisalibacter sp. R2A 31.J]MBZ9573479.1 AraC family transcriptional regulator [Modicisalibacter sp. MOD 31.J]
MTIAIPSPEPPSLAARPDDLTRMAELISPLVEHDGFQPTRLPGVHLVASHCGHARTPLIYEPGLIVVVQGGKVGYLDDRVIHYGAGHYLVQALPLPFECETHASADEPLLGVSIRLDRLMLGELAQPWLKDAGQPATRPSPMAAVPLAGRMTDNVLRLLECLHDSRLAEALGDARIREVVFEALRGPQGDSLRQLLAESGQYARIGQALNYLHRHYTRPLSVEVLAEQAAMSASHFHHHFKHTTHLAPMQYLKRLRLLKARALLDQQGWQVGRTASEVGYQSASQFSRDYKRYFGISPAAQRRGAG